MMVPLACSTLFGFATGWIFFSALWESVRQRTSLPTATVRRFHISPLLRSMLIVVSLFTATLAGPGSLIASLCGILAARGLIIRKIAGGAKHV